jgi:hypothetical protein
MVSKWLRVRPSCKRRTLNAFTQSVTEAQKLSQPEDFDYLHRIGDSYSQVRRYAPALLGILRLKAAPAARDILEAGRNAQDVEHRQHAQGAQRCANQLRQKALGKPGLHR